MTHFLGPKPLRWRFFLKADIFSTTWSGWRKKGVLIYANIAAYAAKIGLFFYTNRRHVQRSPNFHSKDIAS